MRIVRENIGEFLRLAVRRSQRVMEARGGKTAGLDAKHDSPVGKADAPRSNRHA